MTRILSFLLIIVAGAAQAQKKELRSQARPGYEISLQLPLFRNQQVYLAHYFGEYSPVVDSVLINANGNAVFRGKDKLPGGMYLILFPGGSESFDFILDTLQHFTIKAAGAQPSDLKLQFVNSPQNTALHSYESFMNQIGRAVDSIQQKAYAASSDKELNALINTLDALNNKVKQYKDDIINKYSGSLLSDLLIAMREPALTGKLKDPANAVDSAKAKQFIKDHYWDGVKFWDGRLAYSPFLGEKVDKYFSDVIDKSEDTAKAKIDWMLGYASPSEQMTKFLLSRLVYGSIDHKYKWGDEVLVHIFEKYFSQHTYGWLTEAARKEISEKAYLAMGGIVGASAPAVNLPGPDGKEHSLDGEKGSNTIVCFWDVTCSHCRETLPKLDSAFKQAWQKRGIKVFCISMETEGKRADWLNFINDHKLQSWTNVYYSIEDQQKRAGAGLKGYTQLYDVWYYPSFFLLDKQNKFIAKKLKFEQLADIISSLGNTGD